MTAFPAPTEPLTDKPPTAMHPDEAASLVSQLIDGLGALRDRHQATQCALMHLAPLDATGTGSALRGLLDAGERQEEDLRNIEAALRLLHDALTD